MKGETISRTIETIYDAAVSFDRWPAVLDQLSEIFGCSGASLVERSLETLQGRAVGIDPPSLNEYFGIWNDRNIYNMRTAIWKTGEIVTDQNLLPKSELLSSDYYNGFLKPRDMCSLLRISLRTDDRVRQTISLMRPPAADEFQKSDVEVAATLLPHLQRSALIMRRLQGAGLIFGAMTSLLEENPTGIVLLTHTGSIVFANRAARTMAALADGFVLRRDHIEALRGVDNSLLQRLISGATSHSDKDTVRGGPLRLPRKSGFGTMSRWWHLYPSPLKSLSGQRPLLASLSPTLRPRRKHPRSLLRQIYGLTVGEAQVAERLITGDTLQRAAGALTIKVSTARVHLAALFRKTETHRQADLVRLLHRCLGRALKQINDRLACFS